jgi:hypothetical protein
VDESVANTLVIAEQCTAEVEGEVTTPIYSVKGGHDADAERLLETVHGQLGHKTLGKREGQAIYEARFEREIRLLIDKKFCGYFLMWADYCRWAKSNGILVGPGRGSGGGSLVAYLAGITEIDPVDADLLFERFLTEGRMSLPDFDVDFPASARRRRPGGLRPERWGAEYVTCRRHGAPAQEQGHHQGAGPGAQACCRTTTFTRQGHRQDHRRGRGRHRRARPAVGRPVGQGGPTNSSRSATSTRTCSRWPTGSSAGSRPTASTPLGSSSPPTSR